MTKKSGAKQKSKKAFVAAKTNNVAQTKITKTTVPVEKQTAKHVSLQRWNVWLAVIFGAQAIAILLLSVVREIPVTLQYLAPNPLASDGALANASRQLFEVNIVQLVAAFLLLAAIGHIVAATAYRKVYETELKQGLNRIRWIDYGATGSVMLMVMALLGGVRDLASLFMIFMLSVVLHSLGLLMELHSKGKPTTEWTTWRIACAAGLTFWGVLILYAFGAHVYGRQHLPMYVCLIYVSMAVIFGGFAVNLYLQHTRRGRWTDYLFGEKIYLVLSLLAKTTLAWLVFWGLLRP